MKKTKYSSGNKVESSLEQYFNGKIKDRLFLRSRKVLTTPLISFFVFEGTKILLPREQ